MAEYKLNAQERTVIGKKVGKLRRNGIVPIVVYGSETAPVHLQVNYRELEMTLRDAGGTNLIEIAVEGNQSYNVLARDVQRDVVRRDILHADFFAISANARITVEVPVVMINESPAVAARKGILLSGPNTLSVEMRASNMLDQIEIDLSSLEKVGDSIYVKDLNFGENARVLNDPEEMIARVAISSAARREEALAAAAGLAGEGEEGEGEGEGEGDAE